MLSISAGAQVGQNSSAALVTVVRPASHPAPHPASLGWLVAAGAPGLVDLLAHRADRVALRVAVGHPDLAAQRDRRCPHDVALDDLVLAYVVREPLVVAVTAGRLRGGLFDRLDRRADLRRHGFES